MSNIIEFQMKAFIEVLNGNGRPPKLRRLDISILKKDEERQRETVESRARKYAENWQDILCPPIIVNHRKTGGYYIIDGAHRVLAKEMCGITDTLALVYEGLSRNEEGILFIYFNSIPKKVMPAETFRIGAKSGIKHHKEILDLVHQYGFSISDRSKVDGKHINCIRKLEKIYIKDGPIMLEIILKIIKEAWDCSFIRRTSTTIISGLWALLSSQKLNGKLDGNRLIKILQNNDPRKLITKTKGLDRGSHSEGWVCAKIIAYEYDKHLSEKNKIADLI